MIPEFVRQRENSGDGFDLYFAGAKNKKCEDYILEHKGNRLQSQLNDRNNISFWCENAIGNKLFIDSGAFTAHTIGTQLNVDEYIQYINSIDSHIHCFAQVDHIPGVFRQPKTKQQLLEAPKLSWDNYLYMKDRVVSKHKLLPIFHQGEDFKWLHNMLEFTDTDGHIQYIGISPANDVSIVQKEAFIRKCFDVISNSSNPNVKTHAFGMTSLSLLERYPFYSADSTSWKLSAAMGCIYTDYGNIYVSERGKFDKNYILNQPKQAQVNLFQYISDCGYTFDEVSTSDIARYIINIQFLMKWAKNYKFKGASKLTTLF